jgi:GT2 family glycosyltransferase
MGPFVSSTLSHIICSRNRATQLETTLAKLDRESIARHNVELLLVGLPSDEATISVMEAYAKQARTATHVLRQDRPGASVARNLGARAATSNLFVFTDDDCYLEKNFYDALRADFDPSTYHYGVGQVLLFDPSDDRRIAIVPIGEKRVIQPRSLLPAGLIAAANLFVVRQVFERLGGFSEDLGPGTPFGCEDIEFGTRASLAGYIGVLLPSVIVYHHHGRKPGTPESEAILHEYDTGRGSYYAIQLTRGINEGWQLWSRLSATQGPMPHSLAVRLEREFRGAADYLKYYLSGKA